MAWAILKDIARDATLDDDVRLVVEGCLSSRPTSGRTRTRREVWPGALPAGLQQGESAYASTCRGERDHRSCRQLALELLDAYDEEPDKIRWKTTDDLSHEDDRRSGCSRRGEERSEVGVGGDDGPAVRESQVDDSRIGRSGCPEVTNVHRVVTGVVEQARDPRRQVLVDE